jgi:hypothetical protein
MPRDAIDADFCCLMINAIIMNVCEDIPGEFFSKKNIIYFSMKNRPRAEQFSKSAETMGTAIYAISQPVRYYASMLIFGNCICAIYYVSAERSNSVPQVIYGFMCKLTL